MISWRDRLRESMDDDPAFTLLFVPFVVLMGSLCLGTTLLVIKGTWLLLFINTWGASSEVAP